eukprot:TRINITY_DN65867_c0_g1_i1.p1 TRINITY_DN65867_c0_g1~~TRINITY_DN65867_c0_g1_i1.p1  ORF type:complete len:597 (+),score=87.28 TRINITY_DN65867_c0_g1_i1:246-1793(+)
MDSTCEVWQFHALEGCYRGQPFLCAATGDAFALGSTGARLRSLRGGRLARTLPGPFRGIEWQGDQRRFSTYESVEPYAHGPQVNTVTVQDGTRVLVRRHGPHSVDISMSCWSNDRLPSLCCPTQGGVGEGATFSRHATTSCWASEEDGQRCCSLGVRVDAETGYTNWYDVFLMATADLSEEERQAWEGAVPPIRIDEEAFARKRRRWRAGLAEASHYCACGRGATDREVMSELIPQLIRSQVRLSRTFVDIGAGRCGPPDPLHALLAAPEAVAEGFHGLAVDMSAEDVAACSSSLGPVNATARSLAVAVDPATVQATLRPELEDLFDGSSTTSGHPWPLDLLVVDIDGCDCPVTAELLQLVTPKIIVLEINFGVPPPFRYSMLHDASRLDTVRRDYEGDSYDPAAGCSLSYALHMLRPFGFHLLRLARQDAIFVHESVGHAFEGLADGPLGAARLPLDEMECFRRSSLWMQLPAVYVQEWFFTSHPGLSLARIWSNMSVVNKARNRSGVPFALDY